MGLDICAYEKAELTPPHKFGDDCDEAGHVYAYVLGGHERSLRGLEAGRCYEVSGGDTLEFRAGSYSGYNEWRAWLSQQALGVTPAVVWNDPPAYVDRPFYELIDFADNEGTIGPEAAADLAADFRDQRAAVFGEGEDAVTEDWLAEKYDLWQGAFEVAASGGLVQFT